MKRGFIFPKFSSPLFVWVIHEKKEERWHIQREKKDTHARNIQSWQSHEDRETWAHFLILNRWKEPQDSTAVSFTVYDVIHLTSSSLSSPSSHLLSSVVGWVGGRIASTLLEWFSSLLPLTTYVSLSCICCSVASLAVSSLGSQWYRFSLSSLLIHGECVCLSLSVRFPSVSLSPSSLFSLTARIPIWSCKTWTDITHERKRKAHKWKRGRRQRTGGAGSLACISKQKSCYRYRLCSLSSSSCTSCYLSCLSVSPWSVESFVPCLVSFVSLCSTSGTDYNHRENKVKEKELFRILFRCQERDNARRTAVHHTVQFCVHLHHSLSFPSVLSSLTVLPVMPSLRPLSQWPSICLVVRLLVTYTRRRTSRIAFNYLRQERVHRLDCFIWCCCFVCLCLLAHLFAILSFPLVILFCPATSLVNDSWYSRTQRDDDATHSHVKRKGKERNLRLQTLSVFRRYPFALSFFSWSSSYRFLPVTNNDCRKKFSKEKERMREIQRVKGQEEIHTRELFCTFRTFRRRRIRTE